MYHEETRAYRRLAAAILLYAVLDLRKDPQSLDGLSASRFVSGPWFETLCECLDLDPETVRGKALSRRYPIPRAALKRWAEGVRYHVPG